MIAAQDSTAEWVCEEVCSTSEQLENVYSKLIIIYKPETTTQLLALLTVVVTVGH